MTPHRDRPIITLLSDFGTRDGYVGSLKGVLLSLCPEARLIDITHRVPAHDILPAALILEATAPFFPPGTVHLVVVDPGVGSSRRALAASAAGQYFVGPDNGLFTPFFTEDKLAGVVAVDEERLHVKALSSTFHGRDLFAPAAAHIARGADYRLLGEPLEKPVRLVWPGVERRGDELVGTILYVDHFGNGVTSIRHRDLAGATVANVRCRGFDFGPLRRHYAEVVPSAPVALINSMGRLEVALAQANAAVAVGFAPGDEVSLSFK
jgi:hypothetical protein